MSPLPRIAALVVFVVGLLCLGASVVLAHSLLGYLPSIGYDWLFDTGGRKPDPTVNVGWAAAVLAFGGVGVVVIWHSSNNRVGWLFLALFVCVAVRQIAEAMSYWQYVGAEAQWREGIEVDRPYPVVPLFEDNLNAIADYTYMIASSILIVVVSVFPDGRLLSRRWAWVPILFVVSLVSLREWELTDPVSGWMYFLAALGAAASLVVRYRRAEDEERHQLRWVAWSIGLSAASYAATTAAEWGYLAWKYSLGGDIRPWDGAPWVAAPFTWLFVISISLFPVTVGIAILRFHLYDIDIVINRSLMMVSLATFVALTFVAVSFLLDAALGEGTRPSLSTSIVAAGMVAVAFQPIRARFQRWVDRVVYGRTATPHEALSSFSATLVAATPPSQHLELLVRLLAGATGAAQARIWLRRDDIMEVAAALDPHDTSAASVKISGGPLAPERFDADIVVSVVHEEELLGAVSVTKPRGNRVSRADRRVAADLANQAGLVMRNMLLADELLERIEELRTSRLRLVSAHDEARRQLERDLHDAAQHRLLTVKLKLGLAGAHLDTGDVAATSDVLGELAHDTDRVIDTIRDLAHGLCPPLLEAEGVAAAIAAETDRVPFPVAVRADHFGRYPDPIETATYYCLLEALQNVTKHSRANRVDIELKGLPEAVEFTITDDGIGFRHDTPRGTGLTNMMDRADAVGGTLFVSSSPNRGTTVTGRLPLNI